MGKDYRETNRTRKVPAEKSGGSVGKSKQGKAHNTPALRAEIKKAQAQGYGVNSFTYGLEEKWKVMGKESKWGRRDTPPFQFRERVRKLWEQEEKRALSKKPVRSDSVGRKGAPKTEWFVEVYENKTTGNSSMAHIVRAINGRLPKKHARHVAYRGPYETRSKAEYFMKGFNIFWSRWKSERKGG
jgi:hypothetical protein